jgi:hypothetical protein
MAARGPADPPDRGEGWIVFIGVLFLLIGTLNLVYGIAAIDGARFFVGREEFILSDLRTWGWITLVLGVVQISAAVSITRGGTFGRIYGIAAASLNAFASLLALPGYPFWSLAVFALSVLVIYGLAVYGGRPSR